MATPTKVLDRVRQDVAETGKLSLWALCLYQYNEVDPLDFVDTVAAGLRLAARRRDRRRRARRIA